MSSKSYSRLCIFSVKVAFFCKIYTFFNELYTFPVNLIPFSTKPYITFDLVSFQGSFNGMLPFIFTGRRYC